MEGHPDALREIRSMTIAGLPAPPQPMMARRTMGAVEGLGDDDAIRHGAEERVSTHDLLAHMMNLAASHASEKLNRQRLKVQQRAFDALVAAFDALDPTRPPPPEVSYDLFATFFRAYLAAYFPDNSTPPDVRIFPLDTVLEADAITARMRDFVRAQNVLYGDMTCSAESPWAPLLVDVPRAFGGTKSEEIKLDPNAMTYRQLVSLCAKRIMDSK